MILDRHGCKLQHDWSAQAYNRKAVLVLFYEDVFYRRTNFFFAGTEEQEKKTFSTGKILSYSLISFLLSSVCSNCSERQNSKDRPNSLGYDVMGHCQLF